MRIDAHQHFWIYNAARDGWIGEDMTMLRRNFMPTDIAATLREHALDGVVAVQADQSAAETQFLVDLSTMYALIKGVVGWVDLQAPDIKDQLQQYQQYPVVKGFRHIVEGEDDPDFMMRPSMLRGIAALTEKGYTYDLLIRPRHYGATLACVAANPDQKFMLDHMAKPPVQSKAFTEWSTFIEQLASFPNVYCKVSGLATEADWKGWTFDEFMPYIAHVVQAFGPQRVVYGSDWPVCLLAGSYAENFEIVDQRWAAFHSAEMQGFWGDNAVRFYNL